MNEPANSQRNLIWFQKNRDSLWRAYAGRWIAIEDEQVVGVGDSASEALECARQNGFEHPVVTGVRKTEYQKVTLLRRG